MVNTKNSCQKVQSGEKLNQELISIIIPAYNIQDYLKECVLSVLCQSYQQLEILIIDDGSTDKTADLCDELSLLDERIHIIHKKNGGLSEARNTGISNANGTWLCFLDGDDCLFPQSIEQLYHAAVSSAASVAIGSYLTFSEKIPAPSVEAGPVQILTGPRACGRIYSDSYYINFTTAWAKLYQTDHFHYRYTEQRYHEDEFVTYRVLYEQERVAYIPAPVYAYRKRSGSIMQTFSPKNLDTLDALEEQCSFWLQNHEEEYLGKAVCRYLTKIMSCAYKCRYVKRLPDYQRQLMTRFHQSYHDWHPFVSGSGIGIKSRLWLFDHMPSTCMLLLHFAIKSHLFPQI